MTLTQSERIAEIRNKHKAVDLFLKKDGYTEAWRIAFAGEAHNHRDYLLSLLPPVGLTDSEREDIEYVRKAFADGRKTYSDSLLKIIDRLTSASVGEPVAVIAALSGLQAEAQAPTTAASVLTEDDDAAREHLQTRWEKYPEGTLNIPVDRDDLGTVLAALERVALTVGAPAPAPTMPTREETPK